MKNNQRGGIISNIILVPVVLVIMGGFFFLGYYVGKYQGKSGRQTDAVSPLPDIISKNIEKADEFTFYKTLTDRDNKTVSIDLHPKTGDEEKRELKKPAVNEAASDKGAQQPRNARASGSKVAAVSKPQAPLKKDTASTTGKGAKARYTLQISAYQEKDMAEQDIRKMKQRGYAAFILASELPGKGTWYRVRVGSFSSKASAEKLQKELQSKEGISPFITIE
jgi:cell division septation protein DedD